MNHHYIKLLVPIIVILLTVLAIATFISTNPFDRADSRAVTSFEECVAAGNLVMESYPRRCASNGETFTETIVSDSGKTVESPVRIASPLANAMVKSPLAIRGEARGAWFFEAEFPVILTDWDGYVIAEGYATAQGEWMTKEFVPFTATLAFTRPTSATEGRLIFKAANASGLPQHDAMVEVPVRFQASAVQNPPSGTTGPTPAPSEPDMVACTMEAKLCPDGSYVGRQGPRCEFAPCPGN
jgi:hypothetical protein